MAEGEEEGSFERPPITADLRQILEKYPDGGQILKVRYIIDSEFKTCQLYSSIHSIISSLPSCLEFTNFKEFIQNAVDAKATKIQFLVDTRGYPYDEGIFPTVEGKACYSYMQVHSNE